MARTKSKNRKSGVSVRGRTKEFNTSIEKFSRVNSVDAFNTADVLPNPDPVLSKITSQFSSNFQQYKEILWDAHLTAVIASRKSVTTSKEWYIEKNGAPARVVKLVEKAFKMFNVHRATEEILDARLFGMQPMEPVWGRPENFEGESKIFPVEFTGRPPYWFQYDNENKLRFRSKENSWPGEEIKPYSLIVPRNNPKYDNPYGEALLSVVYYPVTFKKTGYKYWVEYVQKFGSPFLEGRVPRSAGDAEFDQLLERLNEMANGSSIVIPQDAELTVHSVASSGGGGDTQKKLVDFSNAEISKAIIGQTLTTEAGDKGARALGEVHNEVRLDLAQSDEILCENCFGELIRWIVDLNFGPNIVAPTFKYDHEDDIKEDLAERDTKLNGLGVKFNKEYFEEEYNLNSKHFEVVEVEEPEQEDPEFAENKTFEDQAALDAFINNFSDEELQKQADGIVNPIIEMVSKANSFEEALEGVIELFPEIDTSVISKQLGRALFNTQNLGRGGDD